MAGFQKPVLKTIAVFVSALVMVCTLWVGTGAAWADDDQHPLAAGSMHASASKTLADVSWERLWGDKALDTMVAITRAGNYPKGGTVVLVTANGFWDALTAAGLAGLSDAPVIMTDGKTLSPQAQQMLALLKPKTIIVSGGTAALSEAVAKSAGAAAGGATVKRCWGQHASDTAVENFKQAPKITGQSWSKRAFVCTDASYYDALSAAPISYALRMPIFLTNGHDDISNATLSAIKSGGFESVYIVGGSVAITPNVEKKMKSSGIKVAGRLRGQTAIDTSGEVAAFGLRNGMTADGMGVATSGGYWDALAGAAFCGRNNAVIVLASGPTSSTISGFVRNNASSISNGYIFGGHLAVSYSTELALNGQAYDKWSSLLRAYRDDAKVNQLLFVKGTGGTNARIELYQKTNSSWTRTLSCQGWVGEDGIGQASESWSATPEGDFGITGAFGVKPSPGTKLSYLQVTNAHYWCSDTSYYNRLINIYEKPHECWGEHLIDYPTAYEYGLFFDYNTNPVVCGAGSAFFIHCKINASYTAGCVMMDRANMIKVIQSLSPGARVCIHMQ